MLSAGRAAIRLLRRSHHQGLDVLANCLLASYNQSLLVSLLRDFWRRRRCRVRGLNIEPDREIPIPAGISIRAARRR
jgi:hypothetical protein